MRVVRRIQPVERLAIERDIDRLVRGEVADVDREAGDVRRVADERAGLGVLADRDVAGLELLLLGFDADPIAGRRNGRVRGGEIDERLLGRGRRCLFAEELHHARPIAAFVAPPVVGGRLFEVGEVRVERGEAGAHEAGLGDRHGLIGAAVEDIDAVVGEVREQLQRVAGRVAAKEQGVDVAWVFPSMACRRRRTSS